MENTSGANNQKGETGRENGDFPRWNKLLEQFRKENEERAGTANKRDSREGTKTMIIKNR